MQGALPSTGLRARGLEPWLQDGLKLGALLGALFTLGLAGSGLERRVHPPVAGDEALNGAGWEGRRMAAQILWLKTHAVLHAGVEERAARPGEEKTRAGEFHSHSAKTGGPNQPGDHADHDEHGDHEGDTDHDGHVFVIPPAREDFRGILGDLERETKPYAVGTAHFSKDQDQMLPFYRLLTWADPHFVQGYTTGATFLCRAGQHPDEGIAFLLEGARNNPHSYELQMELGHFYLVYKKEYAAAEEHLRKAVEWAPKGTLSENDEEAVTDAYRWRALNFLEWGKPKEAVEAAKVGLRIIGEDPSLRRVLERKGIK
ncbi:MAG TPA: hypothetical protein VFU47_05840 [Armatimonadota bacterium]|nr:hypothetical protein [Armatimonadota bacterium]